MVTTAQAKLWSPQVLSNGAVNIVKYNAATTPSTLDMQTVVGVALPAAGFFVSGMEFTPDGRLWTLMQGTPGSMMQGLYTINFVTGAATQVGPPLGLAPNEILTDLTWNPKTHRMSAMATTSSGGLTSRILDLDINTGAVTNARTVNSTVNVLHVAMTADPNGSYFFVDIFNNWLSELNGGDAMWLGSLFGFNANLNCGLGTEFQGANAGRIWMTAYNQNLNTPSQSRSGLYQVDPNSGSPGFWVTLPGGSSTIYSDVTVQPVVNSCPADFTLDSEVADSDFVVFAGQYEALDCASASMPAGCSADLNFDGLVDDTDFVLFAGAYETLICP
ncbi:MAG: hypothetical protein K2Y21_06365 [Phycisphaerales bacterium]|nr:hypothetical protein [Phycisphaerales bacterium]